MQCAFESPAVIVPPGALAGADEVVTVGWGAPAIGGFVAAPGEFPAVAEGDADAEPDGDRESDGDGDGDAGSDGGSGDGAEVRDCGGDGCLDVGVQRSCGE
jgi:hypothetical protein